MSDTQTLSKITLPPPLVHQYLQQQCVCYQETRLPILQDHYSFLEHVRSVHDVSYAAYQQEMIPALYLVVRFFDAV